MKSLLVIAVAAGGCSWADAITRNGALPAAAGPCLQIVHPARHVWELYRGDQRIGGNAPESYALAVADHEPSARLLRSSHDLELDAAVVGVAGMLSGLVAAAPYTLHLASGRGAEVAAGSGAAIAGLSFLMTGVLLWLSDKHWGDAVAGYNDWAAGPRCRRMP